MSAQLYLWAAFTLIPLAFGYFFGKRAEAKHFASINLREKEWLFLPTTASRVPLDTKREVGHSELVYGNIVVASDYFKRLVAGLRSIIGGPVQSYETLLDRARREAVLRLKESCKGADEIINLRLETSSIAGQQAGSIVCVEVIAYGTAIWFAP